MKGGRGNAARGVAAAGALAFLLFVVLVAYAPDSVALSPSNYGWNGLHDVATKYDLAFTTSLASISPSAVLVVMEPSANYSARDAQNVREFLAGGGTLLVADKSGVANSLLEGLGVPISIQGGYAVDDPIYNWKATTVPTALVPPSSVVHFPRAANVTGLALNQPSPLKVSPGAFVIGSTSQLSYEVEAGTSAKVASGPFAVAAAAKVGAGTVFVVGDPQLLFNSEWTSADNEVLIGNLFGGVKVLVDASHWSAGPLSSSTAQLKAELGEAYAAVSAPPAAYAMTVMIVAAAMALVPAKEGPGAPAELASFRREVPRRGAKDTEDNARQA